MKMCVIFAVVLISAFNVFSDGVYGGIPGDELIKQINQNESFLLNGFESDSDLENIEPTGDIVAVEIETDKQFVKSQDGSLRMSLNDKADETVGGRPFVAIKLDKPVELGEYRALSLWVYTPERLSNYFFGRYDVNIILDGKTSWSISAIQNGWLQVVWDFSEMEIPQQISEIRVQFGPLLDGYNSGTIYIDDLKLVKKDSLPSNANLGEVITKDPSWSRRWRAVDNIRRSGELESLKWVIKAAGDNSKAVRGFSVEVMTGFAEKYDDKIIPQLEEALVSGNWRARLAIAELILKSNASLGHWTIDRFYSSLYDDNYYVRSFAYKSLIELEIDREDILAVLANDLKGDNKERVLQSTRLLSEIGADAKIVAQDVLAVIRDTGNDIDLRCWGVCALWQIDENFLMPKDWVLVLNLNPGEIHRHLLNRAMDRLEIAGSKAVPVLISALDSKNDQVRARACVILGSIGSKAQIAVSQLQEMLDDKQWSIAWEANEALAKILPHYKKQTITEPKKTVSQDVVVSRSGNETTVTNGIIELVFQDGDDNPGPKIVREIGGPNLVDASWLPNILAFRYSKSPNMIERQWLQRIFGVPFPKNIETKLYSHDADSADYMIKLTGDESNIFNWEYHFVVRKGDSGFYSYVIVENVSGRALEDSDNLTSQTGLGRYNYLLGLTWGLYDYVYIHDKLKGSSAYVNYSNEAQVEGYPDIYQSAFRTPDGDLFAKHEWENYELDGNVNGYTGKNGGFWMIYPSYDFFGDSMPRHIATAAWGNLFVPHFEGKYYSNVNPQITKDWKKIYGPIYFYINNGDNPEDMWADAKRQAQIEKDSWPYLWLDLDFYQERGSITGKVEIAGGRSASGSYVILSNPNDPIVPDQYSVWMRNVGRYNYWTMVEADGSYKIDNIHTGSYKVYAFKPGVYGEVDGGKIEVSKDKNTDVSLLTIEPIKKGRMLWQIGEADGGAMEFKNGRNYHQWDNYVRYRKDFPNDVHYIVGESDWTQDWNYIQPASVQDEWKAITWTIDFEVDKSPVNNYLLTIMCSGRYANAKVLINGSLIGELDVSVGAHHARTCPYGELVRKEFEIVPEVMREGKNTIHLTFDSSKKIGLGQYEAPEATHNRRWTSWLVYDFIRLEEVSK